MFTLRREAYGDLMTEFDRVSDEVNRLFGAAPRAAAGLPFNVWADENALHAEVDLPGLDPSKLEVTVTEGNRLLVAGERSTPEVSGAVWVRQERPFGRFVREVTLPVLVDADKVEARYENGVLKLLLPKSEAAKPRKITVRA